MTDDQGVLGNLPRSRPGQRSEKRASRAEAGGGRAGGTAKTSAAAASRAERSGSKAAAPPAGARPRSSARRKPATGEAQPTPAGGGADPVRGAMRGVAGLALTGAKVATGVTREVLRRLPRP
jgi:hypothetical protein